MSNKVYAVTIQSDQPLYTEAEAINMVVDKLLACEDISVQQISILANSPCYSDITKSEILALLEEK